jgi:hypothetical protein
MFPISAIRKLSLATVANYWSREMTPCATSEELLGELAKAWWRGELIASGAERADVLRAIYRHPPEYVVFVFANDIDSVQIIPSTNGEVEVSFLSLVLVPNSTPQSWTNENCTEASGYIAEAWDNGRFEAFVPVIRALELDEGEFAEWLESKGWGPTTFWASGNEDKPHSRGKPFSKRTAYNRAKAYIRSVLDEEGVPTQAAFMNHMHAEDFVGDRDLLRTAYNEVAKSANISVARGRRPTKPIKLPKLKSPQIANNAPRYQCD